jgi:glutathione S-transferase
MHMSAAPAEAALPVLVSHVLCPYVQRAVIVLTEKQIPFRRVDIDLADKPDWFRQISPLGKVPLLQTGGAALFESAVICEYLDEVTPDSLHPTDPLEKAHHRGWIEFGSALLDSIAGFYNAPDDAAFAAKQTLIRGRLEHLERHLGPGPYFAGDRFHLVDAVWGPIFRYFDAFDRIADFGFTAGLDKVAAWREALAARPSIAAAVVADYPARLMAFLARRPSHLATLIADTAV